MLFRFCLYGFLKNQQYYDLFFFLAFLEKGLSYTMIGTLIGFREICVSLMEIPTGAIADVLGRRRSMIASFLAYIGSFALFGAYIGSFTVGGLSVPFWTLFVAMFLLYRRRKHVGTVAGSYLTAYAVGRFILEFFRGDGAPVALNLTLGQLTSILFFFAGIAILLAAHKDRFGPMESLPAEATTSDSR